MADLNYTVDVSTSNAQKNLDNLQKKIEKVNSTFSAMKSAIAGIAFGTLITGANQYADAVQDISDATNIATNAILGFNSAVMLNGGNSEQANTSLLKFVQTIGSAAEGSKEAQLAFQEVGVSLTDLQTLSEEDLLKKTVQGINNIEGVTKRMSTQVALFGKNARGISFGGEFGQQFTKASGDAVKYAAAIKAGADAQQSLEMNLKNLTQALLNVVKPLNEIVSATKISVTAFESLVKALTYAVGAYLIFTRGLGIVTTAMNSLQVALVAAGGVLAFFGKQIGLIILNVINFGKNLLRMVGILGGATSAAFSFAAAIAAALRVLLRFTGIVAIIMAVAEAVNFLSKQLLNFDVLDWIAKKFGDVYNAAMKFFGLTNKEGEKSKKLTQEQLKQYHEQELRLREVADAWKKQADAINQTSVAYAKQNTDILRAIGLEKELVGQSKEYTDILRAQEDIVNRAADEVKKLQEAKANLSKDDASLASVYDEQIAKIQQIAVVDGERVAKQLKDLNKLQNAEQFRLFSVQQQIDMNKQLQQVQDDMAKMTMTEIEKKYYDIEAAAKASALAAIQAEEARRGSKLSTEEAQQYYDVSLRGTDRLKESQKKLYENSRLFSTGWNQAFNEYMDNATNAANRARDIFQSVTSSMNNAIDTFVDTGKFSMSDFANSVIRDLIKIELKAATMNLWKAMSGGGGATGGGGGGILSSIGSFLGFAEGGNPPIGKASIVGENGPELIVPRTASTVIPNGAGGGGGPTYNIVNNISAIDAKGVAQLFAENRKVLLGSVEAAKKELPYRTR